MKTYKRAELVFHCATLPVWRYPWLQNCSSSYCSICSPGIWYMTSPYYHYQVPSKENETVHIDWWLARVEPVGRHLKETFRWKEFLECCSPATSIAAPTWATSLLGFLPVVMNKPRVHSTVQFITPIQSFLPMWHCSPCHHKLIFHVYGIYL